MPPWPNAILGRDGRCCNAFSAIEEPAGPRTPDKRCQQLGELPYLIEVLYDEPRRNQASFGPSCRWFPRQVASNPLTLLREYQRGEALVLQADTSIADELYR